MRQNARKDARERPVGRSGLSNAITPFQLAVPEAELADLRRRIAQTRWPEREAVDGAQQGVSLADAQALCAYWHDSYDWRRCESHLNALGQFHTEIDGLGIHFLHVRSPNPDALPLILTHGLPGSVIEFLKVIGPLTDPVAHGGKAADAFHVVVPSLPGYGFSDRPARAGWSVERIAEAWVDLMRRLGYARFVAQGGDRGAAITSAMAQIRPPELAGIHLNFVVATPAPEDLPFLTDKEKQMLADVQRLSVEGTGYSSIQRTRPQTLGYGLTDSPAGQAAWIFDKMIAWTDSGGDPLSVLGYDEILDNIMLYWLPGNAASSARLYWESYQNFAVHGTDLPVGCSIFPGEMIRPSRAWAERKFPNLIHWGELARGGRFAAFEQPALFVDELRATFAGLRG
ncbi:epoxide hydrolase [Novosphingobium sp. MMS21-SN21R]|uniref:epoxide hydrolase family protein n=1 Tax=Novosphingobium sp. MMS21-SN21R TaxID=2969298 RepID=UPI0028837732|nr:epoxide hydrolase [Novosphingobium sp. MMS21-SN21R]MDT0509760.1 epoxide hydrolase [Novosphingobium sp. MMS21-SN21R]